MAVTIEKDVHEKCMISLKNEYVRTFGMESFQNTEKSYSREEYIQIYAKNIKFWKNKIPDIDVTNPTTITQTQLAKHAICTNAVKNLEAQIKKMNIHKEIECLNE